MSGRVFFFRQDDIWVSLPQQNPKPFSREKLLRALFLTYQRAGHCSLWNPSIHSIPCPILRETHVQQEPEPSLSINPSADLVERDIRPATDPIFHLSIFSFVYHLESHFVFPCCWIRFRSYKKTLIKIIHIVVLCFQSIKNLRKLIKISCLSQVHIATKKP